MDAKDTVVHIERVRCLECGTKYVKPSGGGTVVQRNPGCPRCGYVGWIAALVPAPSATPSPTTKRRFAVDPHRHPAVQSR